MTATEIFGLRLIGLRESRNITLRDMVNIIGSSRSAISNYENGKASPSIEVIARISKAFNVTPNYLLGFKEVDDATN